MREINRGVAEEQRRNYRTGKVIGACIEIHKALGPGPLESAYEECLCHAFQDLCLNVSCRYL